MKTIFKSSGKLRALTDFGGSPIEGDHLTRNVYAVGRYELRPSPYQPLVLSIYGYDLFSGGGQWTEELVLENGLVLRGKCSGGGIVFPRKEPRELCEMRMRDVTVENNDPPEIRTKIVLNPYELSREDTPIDAAVFGIVSSYPLGHGGCTNGWARPGLPFSFQETSAERNARATWSSHALRLCYDDLEVFFVKTSQYWKKLVDSKSLLHDTVVGLRRTNHGTIGWSEFGEVVDLLSHFIGWLGHCRSPIYHVKGYRKGKLVYQGYELYPNPTVHREGFSWLPWSKEDNQDEDGNIPIQPLFDGFVSLWKQNIQDNGAFHTALGFLSSHEKGMPGRDASVRYLRDTFGACSILGQMLTGRRGSPGRIVQIDQCLKTLGIKNEWPCLGEGELDYAIQTHPELWEDRSGQVQEQERARGTLARPLANLENWMLHLENRNNQRRLLGLPSQVKKYLLEVSIWLADLMAMKVVGYRGYYCNRMARKVEKVPWENGPSAPHAC